MHKYSERERERERKYNYVPGTIPIIPWSLRFKYWFINVLKSSGDYDETVLN
jgi:hypothetical protein